MTPLFDDTVALVSGASQGIGLAIASRLLDAGCRVALTDLDADRTREAAARKARYVTGTILPVDGGYTAN